MNFVIQERLFWKIPCKYVLILYVFQYLIDLRATLSILMTFLGKLFMSLFLFKKNCSKNIIFTLNACFVVFL